MSIQHAFILPHPPIVVPEVGRGEEKEAKNTIDGFEKIAKEIATIKPDTIIIATPHATMYSDYINLSFGKDAEGDFSSFAAPQVNIQVEYDEEFVQISSEQAEREGVRAGMEGKQDDPLDHGVLVPLYYINKYYSDYKLVRVGGSGLPFLTHYQLGKILSQTSEELGRKTVFIGSGDLSHKCSHNSPYGFVPEGPLFDEKIGEIIKSADFSQLLSFSPKFLDTVAECGLRSFIIMAGALDGKSVNSELFSLECPFGIGYATGSFTVTGTDENRHFDKLYFQQEQKEIKKIRESCDPWVELAQYSLETYIKTNRRGELPSNLPNDLIDSRAGVFVTIYTQGQLRGCIGTIEPTMDTVAEEIMENAISSGTRDPRFPRVTTQELDELVYSVDVLKPAEPISSIKQLDPHRFGVIVSSGRKRGLLLPNLEGVDTPEKQIEIAKNKAGISPTEEYLLERFEVVRHQ